MATRIEFMGTATSHFQSEPNCSLSPFPSSDWEWELQKAIQGRRSGIKEPVRKSGLPQFLRYNQEYVGRSAELGLNMFRFSFDLPRLCPAPGQFNRRLMAEYARTLALIRLSGQEPMVTLHHFTMPLEYVDRSGEKILRGGWEDPAVTEFFRFTVGEIVQFLKDPDAIRLALNTAYPGAIPIIDEVMDRMLDEGLLRYVMPFNEPAVTLGNGYLAGVFPPYKRGRIPTIVKIVRKMADVYATMADSMRELGKTYPRRAPLIGNGYNWQYFDGVGASLVHRYANEWYTAKLEAAVQSDFLGLHYYCRTPLLFAKKRKHDMGYGDHPVFGPINPQGIRIVLKQLHEAYPDKPIFVSEIGFADTDDLRRPFWIFETVRQILAAGDLGVPVMGILLWSLVDNFEWEKGMTMKFGLFSERELLSLDFEPPQQLRSAQVWSALAQDFLHPSKATSARVGRLRERARAQFEKASVK